MHGIPIPRYFQVTHMHQDPIDGRLNTCEDQMLGWKCQMILHPGGHEWGRPEGIETTLRWLAKETSPAKSPRPSK